METVQTYIIMILTIKTGIAYIYEHLFQPVHLAGTFYDKNTNSDFYIIFR